MNSRIVGLIAGSVAAAVGLGLLATTPAFAAASTPMVTVRHAGSSHNGPSQAAAKINDYQPGNRLEAICFVKGDYLNGTDTWLRLAQHHGGGFISRSLVDARQISAC